jgi:hypothetical protein
MHHALRGRWKGGRQGGREGKERVRQGGTWQSITCVYMCVRTCYVQDTPASQLLAAVDTALLKLYILMGRMDDLKR